MLTFALSDALSNSEGVFFEGLGCEASYGYELADGLVRRKMACLTCLPLIEMLTVLLPLLANERCRQLTQMNLDRLM